MCHEGICGISSIECSWNNLCLGTGVSFRSISLRSELQRARVGLRDPERLGPQSRQRSWSAITRLDRLSRSHLGPVLERGRKLFPRWHDDSVRSWECVAAYNAGHGGLLRATVQVLRPDNG